jgi:hypothetical protein
MMGRVVETGYPHWESVMTHPCSQPKKSLSLSDFDSRLNMYALAASAAGVGMLALVQPADGKIIYTKAHKSIGPNTTLHLDLKHDGVTDFDLKDTLSTSSAGGAFAALFALPGRKQNALWGHTDPFQAYASALSANVRIGPKGQFLPGAGFMAAYSISGGRPGNFSCTGPWANVTNRYLGLKFTIKGAEHFGWARLNVSCAGATVNATLTGYAYETVANRPILTGKKSGSDESDNSIPTAAVSGTLGRLARGTKGRPGE